jgi:hypothetical protein
LVVPLRLPIEKVSAVPVGLFHDAGTYLISQMDKRDLPQCPQVAGASLSSNITLRCNEDPLWFDLHVTKGGHSIDRGLRMRRLLLASVMIVFPIAGSIALAGPALAGGSTGVVCTVLKGKVNLSNDSAKITLSKCSDTANTGGGGTTSGSESSTTATITWDGGKGTTTEDNVSTTIVSSGATCPSSDIEEETTGDVTGGTGAAKKSIKKGWTVQSFVCYNPNNNKLSLAPGTAFNIGPSF